VNFTTRDASWMPQVLSLGSTPVSPASISSRGEEFAAAWRHENDSIALRRYSPRTGWSDLTILDRNTRAFVNDPQVFLDAAGTAHVIYNNNSRSLEYSRHLPNSGWSPVEQIFVAGTDQRVGPWRGRIGAAGNLIVVWTDITGESSGANNYNIRAIRYVSGSGWGAPALLNNDNHFSTQPGLAVDAAGNAMAIWQELHASGGVSHYQLWSRRYAPASGWATAQRVDDGTVSAEQAQIALNAEGKAVAVYMQGGRVMVNSAYRTTDWVGPLRLHYMGGTSSEPQVAFDRAGKAFVTWIQSSGGVSEIRRDACAPNLPPINCWLEMQPVTGGTGAFRDLRLVVDSQGTEHLVVMHVTSTSSSTQAIRNVPGRGWLRQPLDLYPGATSRSKPQLAVDESGSALAIWFATYPDAFAVEASVLE